MLRKRNLQAQAPEVCELGGRGLGWHIWEFSKRCCRSCVGGSVGAALQEGGREWMGGREWLGAAGPRSKGLSWEGTVRPISHLD